MLHASELEQVSSLEKKGACGCRTLSCFRQEPYDPEEFVERLAWRTIGAGAPASSNDDEDNSALQLHDAFVEAIKELTQMHEAQKKKCDTLEQVGGGGSKEKEHGLCRCCKFFPTFPCSPPSFPHQKCRDEEQQHWRRVSSLLERNRAAAAIYKSLDERINSVATKVVHLGDQLESVNTPRSRDVEALRLMKHFDEFLGGETNLSPVFNDK